MLLVGRPEGGNVNLGYWVLRQLGSHDLDGDLKRSEALPRASATWGLRHGTGKRPVAEGNVQNVDAGVGQSDATRDRPCTLLLPLRSLDERGNGDVEGGLTQHLERLGFQCNMVLTLGCA